MKWGTKGQKKKSSFSHEESNVIELHLTMIIAVWKKIGEIGYENNFDNVMDPLMFKKSINKKKLIDM